jgi:hypothetical protein
MKTCRQFFKDHQAAVAPITAICIVLLLVAVAVVVDLGHLYVVRAELQNAADAGASAGAQALVNLSTTTGGPIPCTIVCDQAHARAVQTVMVNKADNQTLAIPGGDVQVGIWAAAPGGNGWNFAPAPCSYDINAVKVVTRKTDGVNGPVSLIFGALLGREQVDVAAQAVAMLGWVKGVPKGRGVFPLALGEAYVPPPNGMLEVTFSPNWCDAGGWHTFFDPSASASDLKDIVTEKTPNPEINFGDMINVTNGVDASVVQALKNHFYNDRGGNWITVLPVISSDANYVQTRKVLGFVAFQITEVKGPPDKTVTGYALGGYILPGTESGGINTGLRASLPKLVQ